MDRGVQFRRQIDWIQQVSIAVDDQRAGPDG